MSKKRIAEDILKFKVHLLDVYKAKGAMVPGLGDRSGKRRVRGGGSKRGGCCVRGKVLEFGWIDPKLDAVREHMIASWLDEEIMAIQPGEEILETNDEVEVTVISGQ